MRLSAVDQLVVVSDGDSYAAAMGMIYPTNGGNAQYYEAQGNKVTRVQPEFANQAGRKLGMFPLLFSASEQKYIQLGETDLITFRFNNATSDSAIIARGTLAQFRNNTAVVSGTWNTTDTGQTQQSFSNVFATGTQVITNGTESTADDVEFPVLYVIGQLAYRTKNDITFFCTCQVGDSELTCKGDVEIRSLASENYKVIISASSSLENNATDTVINATDETITLTATLLKNGTSTGVSGQTYNWHKFGENGITMQDGTQYSGSRTGQTLPVTEQMVGGVAEFVCDVSIAGSTYSASITINDIQDDYMIDMGRTTKQGATTVENSGIIKSSYSVVYAPRVIKKSTGAQDMTAGWSYAYQKKNASGGDAGSASGSTLTISGADVIAAGGSMGIIITATNSSL